MLQNATVDSQPEAPARPPVSPFSNALAIYLMGEMERRRNRLQPQHDIYRENYRDREMIPEEDDTRGSGVAKSTKGRSIVIGSTRNKIRSGAALSADSMRSNGRYPYDLETPVTKLQPHANVLRKVLDKVQDEMGMWSLLDKVNLSSATYGDGILVGPFSVTKTYEKAVDARFIMHEGRVRAIPVKESVRFKLPQFRYAHNTDLIPDPDAYDFNGPMSGNGFFWRQLLQPEQIQALLEDTAAGYRDLDTVLRIGRMDISELSYGIEMLKQLRANTTHYSDDGRIAHYIFAGPVPINAIAEWTGKDERQVRSDFRLKADDPNTYRVEAIVDIMGGIVTRVQQNQWHGQRRPGAKFPWERVEDEFFSKGIAANNAAPQKIQTAAARMWIESKSLSLLAPMVYNPDMFIPGQTFKLTPNKALKLKSWVRTAEAAKAAMQKLEIQDVSHGWAEFYELGERLSDIGTGQNQYMQGNPQASHLNPTATGVQLLMGAAQSPMQSVMMNFDQFYGADIVPALADWCVKFLDSKLVAMWFGDDPVPGTKTQENPEGFSTQVIWEQIQDAGMLSMFAIKPTGLLTFKRKGIVFQKVSMLWSIFNQSPAAQQIIKGADFAKLLWKFADTGEDAPMKTQQELDQMLALAEKARNEEMKLRAATESAKAETVLTAAEIRADAEITKAKITAGARENRKPE